jgi:ribosome-associated protein
MEDSEMKTIQSIAQTIYDKKGFNILALDVRDVCSMTNYFIIAEGAVERHVQALSRDIVDKLKELHCDVIHIEGEQSGDWIAVDCGDIMIHILIPELREKYAIEQLWKEGKLIELDIKKKDE